MKAFAIDHYKSKDGGRIVDMPLPEVGNARHARFPDGCSALMSRT
ncbi:MAG: hypothetical protein ACXWZR_08170 [Mycobacterium sp.]